MTMYPDVIQYLQDVTPKIPNPLLKAQFESAISLLELDGTSLFPALVQKVRDWGEARQIIGPNRQSSVKDQYKKLVEEIQEIYEGIVAEDQHAIIDGIGDSTVVLILLAELIGVRFETCLLAAYEEIKDRKGRMIDGIYHKEQTIPQGVFVKDPISMEPQEGHLRGYFIPTDPPPRKDYSSTGGVNPEYTSTEEEPNQ